MPSTSLAKSLALLHLSVFLERVAYYGARSVFLMYMINIVAMNEVEATEAYGLTVTFLLFGKIPGGILADLLGRKRMMIVGGLLQTVALILFSLQMKELFWVSFIVFLTGNSLYSTAFLGRLGLTWQQFPQKRDAGFTLNYLLVSIGAFSGVFVVSSLAMSAFSLAFLLLALIMAVSTGLCFLLETSEPEASVVENTKRQTVLPLISLAIIALIFWACSDSGQSGIQIMTMQKMISSHNLSRIGSLNPTLFQFGTSVGAGILLTICWFYIRLSPAIKIAAGALLTGAGLIVYKLLIGSTENPVTLLLIVSIILGFGEVLTAPIINSFLADLAPRKYLSTSFSVFQTITYGSTFIVSSLTNFGPESVLVIAAVALVFVAAGSIVALGKVGKRDAASSIE